MLQLDASLFIVSALVACLLFILNRLYFKPIGKVIDERETKIQTENERIESLTNEIQGKTLHIEKLLKDTQKEARKIKEDLIQKAEEVKEQVISEARQNSKETFDAEMKQLDDNLVNAEKKLEQEIILFSGKIKEIFLS